MDVIRGFTIYLVVLGHCIQYATPLSYDFNNNLVFRLIYGFHMPLFMIMSGYLFWYSLDRYDLFHGIWAKIRGIMIPCAAWGLITYLCDIVCFEYGDISLGGYLYYTFFSNWFLWAVFYCSLYGFATKYIFHNHVLGYVVFLGFNWFIPTLGNYAGTKRMLPFFLIGMLLNRYGILKILQKRKKIEIMIITILLGIFYVAVLRLQCVELITGMVGSAFVILLFRQLCERWHIELLQKLGKVSIGIYLFTGIIFWFFIKEYFRISDSYRYLIKSAYVFALSVGLTLLAFGISRLLQKNKVTSKLFLGK